MNLINSSPPCSDATHACPAAGPHQVSYPAFYRFVDCLQLGGHGTDDGMDIQGGSDIQFTCIRENLDNLLFRSTPLHIYNYKPSQVPSNGSEEQEFLIIFFNIFPLLLEL